jgi:hypothetical protein
MQFGDLAGLTSLPVERIRHRFRNEDVLTVLPVVGGAGRQASLLVATPRELAIVTGDGNAESREWMTYLAPWDTVRLAEADGTTPGTDEDAYGLTVVVGGLPFHARMTGLAGQRALRDFVVATQSRWAAPEPSR